MKNFVTKGVLIAILSCAAYADGGFVGVSAYLPDAKLKWDGGSTARREQVGFGLKIGGDDDDYRTYFEFVYNLKVSDKKNLNIEWSSHRYMVGADATPKIWGDFKLILGVYGGFTSVKYELRAPSKPESDKGTGWLAGAKIGVEYVLNDNSALELGLKGDKTRYKFASDSAVSSPRETNAGPYFGYSYKF